MSKPEFVYETRIRTTPERLWEAITSGAFTRRYFHAMAIDADWTPGSPVVFRYEDGRPGVEGEVLEAIPGRRLVYTWRFVFDEALAKEQASRVAFEIERRGPSCRLRVVHDRFAPDSRVLPMISEGWAPILCSLKSLLETGEPLTVEDRAERGSEAAAESAA
jgi:uncharacterized protein YndB with AHSA1/START domain